MSVISKMRKQKATYWKRGAADQYGRFSYDDPIEVACRWDDKIGEWRNDMGEKLASVATVYPDQEMFIGDKLKKVELDSNSPDDPRNETGAFEIQAFEIIPNFKNTENLFIAHL